MIWLVLGLALWFAAHLFKRILPAQRKALGDPGKGLVAGAILLSVVLMVIGYRGAEGAFFWGRSPAMVGVNNLLMVFAVYLFAASGAKTWITSKIRHPQLTAVKVWCVSHLLVNGDTPSFVLFGGLLIWAVVEVIVINKADGRPEPTTGPWDRAKEIKAGVGTVIVFSVVAGIHAWLGYVPFG